MQELESLWQQAKAEEKQKLQSPPMQEKQA